jgi:hypothetical protein
MPRGAAASTIAVLDGMFFLAGAVAAGWLAVLTVQAMIEGGIRDWWLLLVLWLILAYLLLPRVHTALALIYVPDYFIGRTRTYEGLLGDPVNVALLGSEAQLHEAMQRAGWYRADELGFRSSLRMVVATLRRKPYPNAPVSPLFLFGRMQDFTYQQEVEGSPAKRHHVRFWHVPDDWYLPGGAKVEWLAAGTFDSRVGLSFFTLQVTHRISRHVDEERDHIVRTLTDGNRGTDVTVIRNFSSAFHSRNGGGDAIITDGDLPVVDLAGVSATRAADSAEAKPFPASAREVVAAVRDHAASNLVHRPITLYFAYGLMLLRALTAIGTLIAAQAGWLPDLPLVVPITLSVSPLTVLTAVLAVGVYVVIGERTFLGRPFARIVALTLSAIGIVVALAANPVEAVWSTRLQLTTLVLDIAILITLSAGDVRDFHIAALRRRRAAPGLAARWTA